MEGRNDSEFLFLLTSSITLFASKKLYVRYLFAKKDPKMLGSPINVDILKKNWAMIAYTPLKNVLRATLSDI